LWKNLEIWGWYLGLGGWEELLYVKKFVYAS
jgi:hypothetical protein